jgi:hypothetical protein
LGEVSTIIKDRCIETMVVLGLTMIYPSGSPTPELVRSEHIREMELKHEQLGKCSV